ncbi:MAG: DUF2029 domain-containing protein [Pseudonocardia sp.]|nr:DUF2029 domain-containing protein [Pseudonocardia sp.]
MIDLHVFDWGGQMVRHNQAALYDGRFDNWLPFLYPPFAALAFGVLDLFSFEALQKLEAFTVFGSVFAVIWLTLGMAADRRREPMAWRTRLAAALLLGAGAMWLEPAQQTLSFGQISALLMLFVVADLALGDKHPYKGVLIGIAAGVKLTPGLFIVYLFITKRFRAAAAAVSSFLVTMVIGFVFLPDQAQKFWSPDGLMSLSNRVGLAYVQNQSLSGYLARISSTADGAHGVWLIAAFVVAIAGLTLAVELHHNCGELGGMLATAVIALLISPISWTHYWVWVIPGLVWGAHEVWYGRRWWGVAPLLTIVLLFFAYPMRIGLKGRWDEHLELLPSGLVWTVPRTADQEKAWDLPQQVMGNLYVIVGVAALIVMAVWLAHARWRDRLALRRLSGVTASQQAMSW